MPFTSTCDCDLRMHKHPDGRCGDVVEYRSRWQLERSAHHLCSRCSGDWNGQRLVRWHRERERPRGECGHFVSKWGTALCAECYDPHAHRGQYDTEAFAKAESAYVRLGGGDVSIRALAREAGISQSAAKRYLELSDHPSEPPQRKSVCRLPSKWTGTETGFLEHRTRGEMPCRECRRGYNREARRRAKRRRAGIPKPLKGPGTTGAWRRLQRQGVPMDEWGEANRTAYRDYQRRKLDRQNAARRARLADPAAREQHNAAKRARRAALPAEVREQRNAEQRRRYAELPAEVREQRKAAQRRRDADRRAAVREQV